MPFIDDLYIYNLAHNAPQVDEGVGRAISPADTNIWTDPDRSTKSGELVSVKALSATLDAEIVMVTVYYMTHSGAFTKTISLPDSPITADHVLIHWEATEPGQIASDWTVTTGDKEITIAGTGGGSATNLRLIFARRGYTTDTN